MGGKDREDEEKRRRSLAFFLLFYFNLLTVWEPVCSSEVKTATQGFKWLNEQRQLRTGSERHFGFALPK